MSHYTRATVERVVARLFGPRAGEILDVLDRYPSEQSLPPVSIDLDKLARGLGPMASSKERDRALSEAMQAAFRTPQFEEFRCRLQLAILKHAGAEPAAVTQLVTTACGGYGFRNVLGPVDDEAKLGAWLRALGALD